MYDGKYWRSLCCSPHIFEIKQNSVTVMRTQKKRASDFSYWFNIYQASFYNCIFSILFLHCILNYTLNFGNNENNDTNDNTYHQMSKKYPSLLRGNGIYIFL